MNPVIASALRRGGVVAGALGATLAGHLLTGAELRMLPVAPLLWLALIGFAVVPGFARPVGTAFAAWGLPTLLGVLGVAQLVFHAVVIAAPWALGLGGHHHRPLITLQAVAIHLGLALVLAVLMRNGERWLARAVEIVAALLAPPRRRAWPRIDDALWSDRFLPVIRWCPGARWSRGPPVPRMLRQA